MPRRTAPPPPGPGRPPLPPEERRIAVALKLRPEVWGLARSLADVAFGGNFTRALEHCIRVASAGLDPTPVDRPERAARAGVRRRAGR